MSEPHGEERQETPKEDDKVDEMIQKWVKDNQQPVSEGFHGRLMNAAQEQLAKKYGDDRKQWAKDEATRREQDDREQER